MELSLLFTDLWKMIKVATNETVFYVIKEIEMKSQPSFSLTKYSRTEKALHGGSVFFVWKIRFKEGNA